MSKTLSNKPRYHYKYLIFLSVFYFMGWTASYPVVYKLIKLGHILESASTLLFPVTYAIADIITEVYGYRVARQVIWSSVFCGFIFSLSLQLISYIPTENLGSNCKGYEIVFGHIFRVYASITAASLIGNFLNVYTISKFKIVTKGKHFWARSLFSTAIGELIFTISGGIMVWGGIQPWPKIALIMINAYVLKLIYAAIAIWPTVLLTFILKRKEKIDIYDIKVKYNPFSLDTN